MNTSSWQPLHHPRCRPMEYNEALAWYWHKGAERLIQQLPTDEQDMARLSWILQRWRLDPVCFAVEALRIKLMPYQVVALLDLADVPFELYRFYQCNAGNPKRQVLIPSGHGLGKTRLLSTGILWMLITHMFSHTLCTAPSSNQLTGRLWSEIRKLFRRLREAWPMIADDWEIQGSSIIHTNPDYGDWNAIARTARPEKPEALQGAHALDDDDADGQLASIFKDELKNSATGGILVVIEEASGVDDTIRKTLEGALSEEGARLLAPGNPTRPDGWFADDIERTDRYAVHTLDCRQSNRNQTYKIPWRDMAGTVHQLTLNGFVSPTYWQNILAECDGDDDADYFRVRVKGQKPRSALFSIIKTHWVESAQTRQTDPDSLNECAVIGLDFGLTSDKHGMAVRKGFTMLDGQEWLPKEDPEQITLEAAERAIDAQELFNARYIIGDSNGVGRGAMEYLTRYYRKHAKLNVKIVHYNSGKGALDNKRYNRRRDEMWHKYGRKWVANPRCKLLDLPGLKRQLTAPQFSERNNVIFVESKADLKKRGIESTNLADALLQTLMIHIPEEAPLDAQPKPDPTMSPIFKKHFARIQRRKQAGDTIR